MKIPQIRHVSSKTSKLYNLQSISQENLTPKGLLSSPISKNQVSPFISGSSFWMESEGLKLFLSNPSLQVICLKASFRKLQKFLNELKSCFQPRKSKNTKISKPCTIIESKTSTSNKLKREFVGFEPLHPPGTILYYHRLPSSTLKDSENDTFELFSMSNMDVNELIISKTMFEDHGIFKYQILPYDSTK